jgi:hypothetical protein
MQIRFRLRTIFIVVFAIAALLAFLIPVARINSATCARIRPGMTEEQAIAIVGVPPGWYDGVGGVSSDAPGYKGYKPTWVALGGEIVVDLDESGRVSQATFYRTETLSWSPVAFFWERFTRIKYVGLGPTARCPLFFTLTAISIWVFGICAIRPATKNGPALHGLFGLVPGAILAIAMFADDFLPGDAAIFVALLPLLGAITGAFTGIIVGFIRAGYHLDRPSCGQDKRSDPRATGVELSSPETFEL